MNELIMYLIDDFNAYFYLFDKSEIGSPVLLGFVIFAAVIVSLRIVVTSGYQTQISLFSLAAKDLKNKSDIKETHSRFLNRVIKDYIRACDKGVASVDCTTLVNKHLLKFNLFGWSYSGIEKLVESFEKNSLFIGLILTIVFEDYRYVYAVGTVVLYLLMRLFGALFNFQIVRKRLLVETAFYIETEIGQFFGGDMGSVVMKLKTELTAVLKKQSEVLGESIQTMGNQLGGILQLSMQEMSKSVDNTMMKVSNFGDAFDKPVEQWNQAIQDSIAAQTSLVTTIQQFEGSIRGFGGIADGVNNIFHGYFEQIQNQFEYMQKQMTDFGTVAETLKEVSEPMTTMGNSLASQFNYIERNQSLLEQSLQKYELSLEEIARKMGDGIGSIVEYQMQTSYKDLIDSVDESLQQILNKNSELIDRMQIIFEQLQQQSMSEMQAVIKMKEQMDIHFETLQEKIL